MRTNGSNCRLSNIPGSLWSTNDSELSHNSDATDDSDAVADNDASENNLQQTIAAVDHSETAGGNEAICASSAQPRPDDNSVVVSVVDVAETSSSDALSHSPGPQEYYVYLCNLILQRNFSLEPLPPVETKPTFAPTWLEDDARVSKLALVYI